MKRIVFECDLCGALDETGDNTQGLLFIEKGLIESPEKFRLVDPLHADKHVCLECMEIFHKHLRVKEMEEGM